MEKITKRMDEIALMINGIDFIIKNHNEPLLLKREELLKEYKKLGKQKGGK